jgi:AraC-like DNA-binding protein
VQGLLAVMLPKGPPHREDVAVRLMMSERTLQRRLAEEGTSFTTLVDDTRRELARQSLSCGELSLKMLSFQLGFSEPSAFYRACKRWFGMTPSDIVNHAPQRTIV